MKDRIKTLRKALGLTQQQFAERIGTTQNVVANYEIGRRNPSASALNNICKEFDVSETWLRTGKGEMPISLSRDEEISRFAGKVISDKTSTGAFKKRFIHMLIKLNEDQWKVLEEIAILLSEEVARENDKNIEDQAE